MRAEHGGARRSRALVREGRRDARQHQQRLDAATRASPATRSRRAAAPTTRTVTVRLDHRKRRASATHERARRRRRCSRTVDLAERLAKLIPEDPERCRSSGRRRTPPIQATSTRHGGAARPSARADAAQRLDRRGAEGRARRRRCSSPASCEANAARANAVATSKGLFAYPPQHRRRPLDHGAHAGRHRLGLGERRRARLGDCSTPRRWAGARRRRRSRARNPVGDRAGTLHGGARAAGGRRHHAAARSARSTRAPTTRAAARSASRRRRAVHAAGREDRRRARDDASPIPRDPDLLRVSRSTARASRCSASCTSRTAILKNFSPTIATGRRSSGLPDERGGRRRRWRRWGRRRWWRRAQDRRRHEDARRSSSRARSAASSSRTSSTSARSTSAR